MGLGLGLRVKSLASLATMRVSSLKRCSTIHTMRRRWMSSRGDDEPEARDPSQHPWLPLAPAPESLLPHERVYTFLAANCAAGRLSDVAQDWRHIPRDKQAEGMEVVLQTHLFAGFPRAINALATINHVGISKDAGTAWQEEVWDPAAWKVSGDESCSIIYGNAYTKLRNRMSSLHPLLDAMMIEHGYGRVMSRTNQLPLRMRELCVLAALSGQDVAPQLTSHIRGAVRCGASIQEVQAVIEQTHLSWGIEAAQLAKATFESDKARYGI